jgi:isoquinoline 1-oxidoreductase beta subunit
MYLGGGFGRKIDAQVAIEAARLSKAAGVPVHVGWTRAEEMRHSYLRPPTHHRLRGVLDDAGQIEALEHQQASGEVAFAFLPGIAETVLGADFGSWRGARINYAIAHRHVATWLRELPLPTGWWRGLGLLANTFAIESFIDELAHASGADPLAFRLAHLPDTDLGRRMRAVLEMAGQQSNWTSPAADGRARGIACCVDAGSVVAEVAEVSLDEDISMVEVHRVDAAIDCGLVINPDGVTAQVEGAVMMGIGSTLIEAARVKDGRLEAANFDRYPLLTMDRAPDVHVHLVDTGHDRPWGVGEPPIGPVAAAIVNAFFNLTGLRMRELPLTPERIRIAREEI